jgi:hypothetical protein
VVVAERFADGLGETSELRAAAETADPAVVETGDDCFIGPELAAHNVAADTIWPVNERAPAVCFTPAHAAQAAHDAGRSPGPSCPEEAAQRQLLRCVIGPLPFRPVPLDPAWLTQSVTGLARAAYEDRALPSGELDPGRLSVLADALLDAGCTDAAILDHLRSPGPHVRGCWPIDLLLAKE